MPWARILAQKLKLYGWSDQSLRAPNMEKKTWPYYSLDRTPTGNQLPTTTNRPSNSRVVSCGPHPAFTRDCNPLSVTPISRPKNILVKKHTKKIFIKHNQSFESHFNHLPISHLKREQEIIPQHNEAKSLTTEGERSKLLTASCFRKGMKAIVSHSLHQTCDNPTPVPTQFQQQNVVLPATRFMVVEEKHDEETQKYLALLFSLQCTCQSGTCSRWGNCAGSRTVKSERFQLSTASPCCKRTEPLISHPLH